MNVKVQAEKVPLRNLTAQLQGRRLNLRTGFHRENDILAEELLKSHLPKICTSKPEHAKIWLWQSQEDAKQVFGVKESINWMMIPLKKSISGITELKGVPKRDIVSVDTRCH